MEWVGQSRDWCAQSVLIFSRRPKSRTGVEPRGKVAGDATAHSGKVVLPDSFLPEAFESESAKPGETECPGSTSGNQGLSVRVAGVGIPYG